ncbi:hypothetical protein [Caballeronia sp. M23-90]
MSAIPFAVGCTIGLLFRNVTCPGDGAGMIVISGKSVCGAWTRRSFAGKSESTAFGTAIRFEHAESTTAAAIIIFLMKPSLLQWSQEKSQRIIVPPYLKAGKQLAAASHKYPPYTPP